MSYTIGLGEIKNIGLTSVFSKDVEVSMYVSNNFAVLTFKLLKKNTFSFDLLPPKPRTESKKELVETGVKEIQRPSRISGAAGIDLTPELPQPVSSSSPVNFWTVLLSLVFVMVLVGGVALYRTATHHLDKPPVVTTTGLGSSDWSGSLSSESLSASSDELKPVLTLKENIAQKPEVVEQEQKQKQETLQSGSLDLSLEKKLELEKYIFHTLSLGFTQDQVKQALLAKGWPEEVIETILEEINSK
jgi:hypothetical protein